MVAVATLYLSVAHLVIVVISEAIVIVVVAVAQAAWSRIPAPVEASRRQVSAQVPVAVVQHRVVDSTLPVFVWQDRGVLYVDNEFRVECDHAHQRDVVEEHAQALVEDNVGHQLKSLPLLSLLFCLELICELG